MPAATRRSTHPLRQAQGAGELRDEHPAGNIRDEHPAGATGRATFDAPLRVYANFVLIQHNLCARAAACLRANEQTAAADRRAFACVRRDLIDALRRA